MNLIHSYWIFALGTVFSLAFGLALWILYGRRLNLYLVSEDSLVRDQALIPVTVENGSRSRRESIDLVLTDFQNRTYTFRVGYGLFVRFYLVLVSDTSHSKLNRSPIEKGKYYPIKNGMKLTTGDRVYTLVATRTNSQAELLRRFI